MSEIIISKHFSFEIHKYKFSKNKYFNKIEHLMVTIITSKRTYKLPLDIERLEVSDPELYTEVIKAASEHIQKLQK
jgi:hypothetical protein